MMMNPQHQQIIEYLRTYLGHGYTHQQLADHMRAHGWTDEQINWAFHHVATYPGQTADHPHAVAGHDTVATHRPTHQQAHPRKYGVFRAIADVYRAVVCNPLGILASIGVAFGMVVGVSLIITLVITLLGTPDIELGQTEAIATLVGVVIVVWAILITIYTVTIGVLTRALMDGANGHKSKIPAIIKASFQQLPRLILTGAQLYARILWPSVAAAVLIALIAPFMPALGLILGFVAVLAGAVWIIIAMLRYALVITVAVFEPHLPVSRCFARSKELLGGAGQWFLVKALGLQILAALVLIFATWQGVDQLGNPDNPIVTIIDALLSLIFMGMLVMLYRNRAAVHGHSSATLQ